MVAWDEDFVLASGAPTASNAEDLVLTASPFGDDAPEDDFVFASGAPPASPFAAANDDDFVFTSNGPPVASPLGTAPVEDGLPPPGSSDDDFVLADSPFGDAALEDDFVFASGAPPASPLDVAKDADFVFTSKDPPAPSPLDAAAVEDGLDPGSNDDDFLDSPFGEAAFRDDFVLPSGAPPASPFDVAKDDDFVFASKDPPEASPLGTVAVEDDFVRANGAPPASNEAGFARPDSPFGEAAVDDDLVLASGVPPASALAEAAADDDLARPSGAPSASAFGAAAVRCWAVWRAGRFALVGDCRTSGAAAVLDGLRLLPSGVFADFDADDGLMVGWVFGVAERWWEAAGDRRDMLADVGDRSDDVRNVAVLFAGEGAHFGCGDDERNPEALSFKLLDSPGLPMPAVSDLMAGERGCAVGEYSRPPCALPRGVVTGEIPAGSARRIDGLFVRSTDVVIFCFPPPRRTCSQEQRGLGPLLLCEGS
ncbi:hypothetical protein DIPPA_20810 [Diplonema papillatum]|nr:hypothetical protein DIPPA_20810 [Diplonema papillatum]|eukprot:gene19293-29727_t